MSVNLEQNIDYNEGRKELPLEFTQSVMHSNDLDVLKKVQREIIPREQSTFGSQTAAGIVSTDTLAPKLTFYVSDPRMYLDMLTSYFTCDFKAIVATNGDVALPAFMDVGGIHACIKTLTIKIGGTILMRLDDYNKWYNINNLTTHSAEYADFMLGSSGDSQDDYRKEVDFNRRISYTVAGSSYDHTAGATENLLTLVGSTLLTDLQIGDLLEVSTVAKKYYGYVWAVLTDTTCNVQLEEDIPVNNIATITIVKRKYEPTRANIVNFGIAPGGAAVPAGVLSQKLQWRLPVGCLSFLKYFPLPYIQDIAPLEIEFEFIDPRLALVLRDPLSAVATNKFGYQISRPRFVVSLVEPSNKVREMHDMLYSGNGLWFPFVDYRHFQNQIAANSTDDTFTFQTNISSARHIISVITAKSNDDAATVATQAVKSQSTFYRSQLNYFRFQSGSLQFPDYGNVQCGDAFASEAWAQLMLSFGMKENTVHKSRIYPWEWQSVNSEKFIISTSLAKDESMWTGSSCKNNFLELTTNKAAVATAYNVHSYLGADTALVISKSAGTKIFN